MIGHESRDNKRVILRIDTCSAIMARQTRESRKKMINKYKKVKKIEKKRLTNRQIFYKRFFNRASEATNRIRTRGKKKIM